MQEYKVVISDVAERDLLDSYYYIYFELQNPVAAEKFKDILYKKISSLKEAPYMGETHEIFSDFRVAHALRYRIFYSVDEKSDTVVVSRIFYAKRQEPTLE